MNPTKLWPAKIRIGLGASTKDSTCLSSTQAVVALGSADAEAGAAVKASQEVVGMMSLWKDVSETTRVHVM